MIGIAFGVLTNAVYDILKTGAQTETAKRFFLSLIPLGFAAVFGYLAYFVFFERPGFDIFTKVFFGTGPAVFCFMALARAKEVLEGDS